MREEKVSCTRCPAKITFAWGDFPAELKRLGWKEFDTPWGRFTLCPHCGHELKRFLAGCEIRKLND